MGIASWLIPSYPRQVIVISLGENLVGTSAPLPAQLFTVVFALAGLVSFALVLALVEQVILTLVEDNVTTGEEHRRGCNFCDACLSFRLGAGNVAGSAGH